MLKTPLQALMLENKEKNLKKIEDQLTAMVRRKTLFGSLGREDLEVAYIKFRFAIHKASKRARKLLLCTDAIFLGVFNLVQQDFPVAECPLAISSAASITTQPQHSITDKKLYPIIKTLLRF